MKRILIETLFTVLITELTLVLIWKLRYFSTYDPDTPESPFLTRCGGNTSKTTNGSQEWYRCCRVAEDEDDGK